MSNLGELITLHRQLYRDDLHIERMVQRQPPTSLDLNTGALHQEPAAAIGMTLSGRLLRYVSHPEGYGADFPWSKALFRVRYWCRREHPYHRASDRPYWRGSLCWQLVTFIVTREWSVENAAKILRYDNPEPVLREALRYIEDAIDRERVKQEKRAREDVGRGDGAIPLPAWTHHAPSPEHVAECPNPVCRARRAA